MAIGLFFLKFWRNTLDRLFAFFAVAFWLLALVLKHLSVGTTYAIWSAVGTAVIALVGIAAYGEGASPLKLASLALIIVGVIGLNAAGAH